jgi:hypothetical protein
MAARKPKEEVDPLTAFLQEITLGRHDTQLVEIINVVRGRLIEIDDTERWTLELGDLSACWDDLTVGEHEALGEALGCTWWAAPVPLASAQIASTYLAVLAESRLPMTADEAQTWARGHKATAVLAAFSAVQAGEVPDPKG